MAILSIIQSFLGAGKTTFSKELAKETDSIRLNADEWVSQAFPIQQYEKNWEACFSEALEAIWQDTQKLLKKEIDVILDIGFWTKDSRKEARRQANYIYAPDKVLLERLK